MAIDFSKFGYADQQSGTIDFSQFGYADEQPEPPGFISNTARGFADRAVDLGGNFIGFLNNVAKDGERYLSELTGINPYIKFGSDGISFEMNQDPAKTGGLLDPVEEFVDKVDTGYEPRFTWEGLKETPTVENIAGYIVEQGVSSVPDMVGALVTLPAYIASRTNEIAEAREANKGETDGIDIADLGESLVPAVAVSVLDRIGAKGIFSPNVGDGAVKAFGRGASREGLTEFVQEPVEYAGETIGTGTAFDPATALDRGFAGLVAGSGIGGPLAAASQGLSNTLGDDIAFQGMEPSQLQKQFSARQNEINRLRNEGLQPAYALDQAQEQLNAEVSAASRQFPTFEFGLNITNAMDRAADQGGDPLDVAGAGAEAAAESVPLQPTAFDPLVTVTDERSGPTSNLNRGLLNNPDSVSGALIQNDRELRAAEAAGDVDAANTIFEEGVRLRQAQQLYQRAFDLENQGQFELASRNRARANEIMQQEAGRRAAFEEPVSQPEPEYQPRGLLEDQRPPPLEGIIMPPEREFEDVTSRSVGAQIEEDPADVAARIFERQAPQLEDRRFDMQAPPQRIDVENTARAADDTVGIFEARDTLRNFEAPPTPLTPEEVVYRGSKGEGFQTQKGADVALRSREKAQPEYDWETFQEESGVFALRGTLKQEVEQESETEQDAVVEEPTVVAAEPEAQDDSVNEIIETPAMATVENVQVKRGENFKTDGTYDVTMPDGSQFGIFRDTDQFSTPSWYSTEADDRPYSGSSYVYLGNTRAEAVDALISRYNEDFDARMVDDADPATDEDFDREMADLEEGFDDLDDIQMSPRQNTVRLDMNFRDVNRRVPELTEAAQQLRAGEITREEYADKVNEFKPVLPYEAVPEPAAQEEIFDAISEDKRGRINSEVPEGAKVGLRLDIPAYTRKGTWVPTIHRTVDGKDTPSYRSTAAVSNVKFPKFSEASLRIAEGSKNKETFARIRGEFINRTEDENVALAQEALNSPEWTQVGMDPERTGYFYDRNDIETRILSADEVIQIGPLVLAKNAVTEPAGDIMFSPRKKSSQVEKTSGLENAFKIARGQRWNKNRDLKMEIQNRVKEAAKDSGINLGDQSPETRQHLVNMGVNDALEALKDNENAIGWYDRTVKKALETVSLIHPEIKTDPLSKFQFTFALAVTSNGQKVDKNFEYAEQVYSRFKRDGRMPTDIEAGETAQAMNSSFALFNRLSDRWGQETLAKFMDSTFTVQQLKKMGFDVNGELADTRVLGSVIIGPKIGNGFYSNLNGLFDQLTIDRWFMATWGRWTGSLIDERPDMIAQKSSEVQQAVSKLSPVQREVIGNTLKIDFNADPETIALQVQKASVKAKNRDILNKTKAGTQLRLAGNSLAGYMDGQRLVPSGGQERAWIREVFSGVLDQLQAQGYDLNMSDLQALLWYPEKRLYDASKSDNEDASAGYDDDEAPDYANAAAKLASSMGISSEQIAAAQQEIDNERSEPTDRRGDRREESAGDRAGQDSLEGGSRGLDVGERRTLFKREILVRSRLGRSGNARTPKSYKKPSSGSYQGVRGLVHAPSTNFQKTIAAAELRAPTLIELPQTDESAALFSEAITASKNATKFGAAVKVYPDSEYKDMKLFVTEDGGSGFAIKSDGDIVSVFSSGGGAVHSMLELAVEQGGTKLDAFNTVLPKLYAINGFKEVGRDSWDDQYMPEGWDKETFSQFNSGEPAVVYMEYDPSYDPFDDEGSPQLSPRRAPESATVDKAFARIQSFVAESEGRPVSDAGIKIAVLDSLPDRQRESAQFALEAAAAFQKSDRVTFVEFDKGVAGFNGSYYKGQMFIDVNSEAPHHIVFGHELVHNLRAEYPDLYDRLEQSIIPQATKRVTSAQIHGFDVDSKRGREEYVADVVGNRFGERSFWESLASIDPKGFKRIARIANDLINKVTSYFRLKYVGAEQRGVKDLDRIKSEITSVMAEYKDRLSQGQPGLIEVPQHLSPRQDDPMLSPRMLRGRRRAGENEFSDLNDQIKEKNQGWNKIKSEIRRQLTPGGLLPKSVFDAKIDRDNRLAAVEFDTVYFVNRLEKAVSKSMGSSFNALPEATKVRIQESLSGNMDFSLPQSVQDAVLAMRDNIDGLSRTYVNILEDQARDLASDLTESESVILAAYIRGQRAATEEEAQAMVEEAKDSYTGGNLRESMGKVMQILEKTNLMSIVTSNMGQYVNRSYRAFDDENWFSKIPDRTLNNARAYLRGRLIGGGLSESRAAERTEVIINDILKEGTAYGSMEAFIKESKLGAKDLSILKRRKDIAPEIRALMGEYEDARINYAKTAAKMSRLIYNTRFLDRVMDVGMNDFLFTDENRPPNMTQIAVEGNKTMDPLNGLYAPRDVAKAFADMGKGNWGPLLEGIIRMNGLVKYGKTVLSPTTQMRNFMSASFFAIANGHFDASKTAKSISVMREYFTKGGDTGKLAYLRKLKELGVVYDTPYAGEMMRLLEDSKLLDLEAQESDGSIRTTIKKAANVATRFYQFGDDFWKIVGFENEKQNLIGTGMSAQEAEVEAAKRIRNTYPTYSMVGKGIDTLRRFPLAGTFVSFPAEIIRTSYNMIELAVQDMKTPGRRALGVKRLVGLSFVSGAAFGIQEITKQMFDVSDEEEEAIRMMSPNWSENSNFAFAGRDKDGNLRYYDISFLDPYNYFKRPITAALRDQPWQESFTDSARDLIAPFFGTDIVATSVFESLANKKRTGGKIWNSSDDPQQQLSDIVGHISRTVRPGVMGNVERIQKAKNEEITSYGKRFTMEDEMAGLFGWRVTTFDPKIALSFRSMDIKERRNEASAELTRALNNPNEVGDEGIAEALDRTLEMRERTFSEALRLIDAARASGMKDSDIAITMSGANLPKAELSFLMRGEIPPLRLSKASMRNSMKRAYRSLGPERAQNILQRYNIAAGELLKRQR